MWLVALFMNVIKTGILYLHATTPCLVMRQKVRSRVTTMSHSESLGFKPRPWALITQIIFKKAFFPLLNWYKKSSLIESPESLLYKHQNFIYKNFTAEWYMTYAVRISSRHTKNWLKKIDAETNCSMGAIVIFCYKIN